LNVVATVLRMYADGLERPTGHGLTMMRNGGTIRSKGFPETALLRALASVSVIVS
jgi:hypothetical protein